MLALNANQLLSEVDSLPLDLKTKLIEKLLGSLNSSEKSIDELWKQEIEARMVSVESGNVNLVDGQEVFRKIQERLAK
ncbi:MAG TPA: addiction module protein [Campylobacterales bacterium]|nr:addiction module protein [Campylobacterales bacterium]